MACDYDTRVLDWLQRGLERPLQSPLNHSRELDDKKVIGGIR